MKTNDTPIKATGHRSARPRTPRKSLPGFMRGRRQRCTAHKTNGEPCARWACAGQMTCATHGGRTPAAKRSAQQLLYDLQFPAAAVWNEIVTKPVSPLNPQSVRAAAAAAIFDRTGLGPKNTTVLEMQAAQKAARALGVDLEDIDAVMIEPATLTAFVERILATVGEAGLLRIVREITRTPRADELAELLRDCTPADLAAAIARSGRREDVHLLSAPPMAPRAILGQVEGTPEATLAAPDDLSTVEI